MEDAAIYTSLLLNFICDILMLAIFLLQVRRQRLTEPSAKTRYSISVFGFGVLSGAVFFPALIYLYGWAGYYQSLAHGASIILMFIFSSILTIAMIMVGRMVLGWKLI